MIRKFTLLSLMAVALLASCNKEDGSETPDEKCLVSQVEQIDSLGRNKQTYSFEYDDQDRMTRTLTTKDSAFTSFDIQYAPGKSMLKARYGGTIRYTLDEQGRISSYVGIDPNKTTVFKYNQDNYLVEIVATYNFTGSNGEPEPPSVYTSKLTYSNGNLIKISANWNSRPPETIITFEYNNEKANTFAGINTPLDQFAFTYPIQGNYGKTSKNELIKATSTYDEEGASIQIVSFQYEKDPLGKTRSIVSEYKNILKSAGKPDRTIFLYRDKFNLKYTCD